jgi:hypothetical protein
MSDRTIAALGRGKKLSEVSHRDFIVDLLFPILREPHSLLLSTYDLDALGKPGYASEGAVASLVLISSQACLASWICLSYIELVL